MRNVRELVAQLKTTHEIKANVLPAVKLAIMTTAEELTSLCKYVDSNSVFVLEEVLLRRIFSGTFFTLFNKTIEDKEEIETWILSVRKDLATLRKATVLVENKLFFDAVINGIDTITYLDMEDDIDFNNFVKLLFPKNINKICLHTIDKRKELKDMLKEMYAEELRYRKEFKVLADFKLSWKSE